MDREIAPEVRRRTLTKRVVSITIAVAAIVFSFAATLTWLRPSIRRADIQTARVDRGPVDATLQAAGTLVPAVEQIITAPLDSRVLRIVRRAGDRVHAGDELVALDTSAAKLDLERFEEQLAQKENEQVQLRLRLDDTLAQLRGDIEQKALDADIFRYKAAQNDKLHAEGLVAKQDALAATTAAKKGDIELAQLRDGLTRAQRTASAQIAAGEMAIKLLRKERDEARRQLDLAMMRADRDGVVTSIVTDSGASVHRGDVVARIADLSSYRVTATISDVHAARIAAGMPVRVRIDDAATLSGTISSVEPRVDNGQAKFNVELAERSHPKLRNNARVDVFVVTGTNSRALRVKRGALGSAEREDAFVVRGDRLVATPVRWGLAGDDVIEVAEGLREGDSVVISNMSDYAGTREMRLK